MRATLTEVHREAKKVFRPVQNGKVVQISDHGKPLARILPDYPVQTMSAAEFRALEISEEELNEAINQTLKEIRE